MFNTHALLTFLQTHKKTLFNYVIKYACQGFQPILYCLIKKKNEVSIYRTGLVKKNQIIRKRICLFIETTLAEQYLGFKTLTTTLGLALH